MAKATPITPKKAAPKSKNLQTVITRENGKMTHQIVESNDEDVVVKNITEKRVIAEDNPKIIVINNDKTDFSANDITDLKNQAILKNTMRGNMLEFEQAAVDKEHRRLTGQPFFKDQTNRVAFWMFMVDIMCIILYFALKTMRKQENAIYQLNEKLIDNRLYTDDLFNQNISLQEQLSLLSKKTE